MKAVTLFFILLATTISHAEETKLINPWFQNENSVEAIQGAQFQKNKDSVFKLLYKGESLISLGSCTNTMISDEGHYITAMHCIKSCFDMYQASQLFSPIYDTNMRLRDGFIGINYEKMRGQKCSAIDPLTNETIEVEFIASGTGTNLSTNGPILALASILKNNPQDAINYVSYGIAGTLDFAIMKRTDANKPSSCVKVSEQPNDEYLNGKKVWTLSYPSASGWESEGLSNGNTRLYSEGLVIADYKDHGNLKEFADEIDLGEGYEEEKKDFLFNLADTKITTLPATPGSSGASIFNEDNEVAGVLSFVFSGTEEEDSNQPGVTYFISAASIRDYVYQAYSEFDVDEIFRCSQ